MLMKSFQGTMSNLIDNAMKYSKESSEDKNQFPFDDDTPDIIKIYDNGIGISKKDQKNHF